MKKSPLVWTLMLASIALVGCGEISSSASQSSSSSASSSPSAANLVEVGTGYGLVHGHYVGMAIVETLDGVVTDITLDEYYLPYNWGKVALTDFQTYPDEVISVVGSRSTSYYAKYVTIGDKLFMATAVTSGTAQIVNYEATGIPNLDAWIATEANAIWYVEQIEDEAFFLATSTGTEHPNLVRTDATSNLGMIKSTSNYWPQSATQHLGWSLNMQAIIDAFVGTSLDFTITTSDKTEVTETEAYSYWIVNGNVTGATLTDFLDYYTLLQRAYANRTEVV
jgi:hypothetical protein